MCQYMPYSVGNKRAVLCERVHMAAIVASGSEMHPVGLISTRHSDVATSHRIGTEGLSHSKQRSGTLLPLEEELS